MLVKQPLARAPRVSATNTGCESWRSPAADSWNGSVCSGRKANRAECKICMKKWQKVPRCVIAFDQSEEEATLRQGWIRPLSGPSHTERMTSNHYHYSCFIALLNQGWLKKFGLEEKKKCFLSISLWSDKGGTRGHLWLHLCPAKEPEGQLSQVRPKFSTWRTASIMCLTKFYFLVRSLPAVINGFNSYLLAPVQSLWKPSKNIFPFYCPDHLVSSSTTHLGDSGPVCVFLLRQQEY